MQHMRPFDSCCHVRAISLLFMLIRSVVLARFWSMLFLTIYMVLGGLLIGNFVMEFITDAGTVSAWSMLSHRFLFCEFCTFCVV